MVVNRKRLFLAPLLFAGVVAGCVTSNPETARQAAAPKTAPMRSVTNFTESLKCMDDLFLAYGKRGITITTVGIPDSTGKVAAGTKEMLISSISRASIKSKAFQYIDYDSERQDLLNLLQNKADSGAAKFKIPDYYIRGAITQLDENALDEQAAASIALPWGDLGMSKDQVVSLVSLDLNMGDVTTRTILPGVGASNTIAVARAGVGGDAGGAISKMGLQFSINMNKSEGLHQAVRVLIELGLVETLGKLGAVPYWQCLQIDKTNPQVVQQARDWYDGMSEAEQIKFIQTKLVQFGQYSGPVNGVLDAGTRTALGRFQQEHNLIADARPSFDTYYALMDTSGGQVMAPPPPQVASYTPPAASPAAVQQRNVGRPVSLVLSSDRGQQPVYAVNDYLNATAQVTSDAFMYCYYKDAENTIARVYPNRFEPNPYVTANRPVSIPSKASSKFRIRFDQAGAREQVACFASSRDIGAGLPDRFKAEDLTPIGSRSMDELANAFRAQDKSGLAQATLNISVR